MIDIVIIDIISTVSLIYSFLAIFVPFAPINEMFLVYIWTILVSIIVASNINKSKLYNIIIILLFLPLIFHHDIKSIIFILIAGIMMSLYVKISATSSFHSAYVNKLKIFSMIYLILNYAKSIINNFERVFGPELNFYILYLISTIVLIRSIRHLNGNIEIKKIRRNNTIYLLFSSMSLYLANNDGLRKSVSDVLARITEIIYYPFYLLWIPIEKFMYAIQGLEIDGDIIQGIPEGVSEEQIGMVEEATGSIIENSPQDFFLFKVVIGFGAILLGIFLIYKLISKFGNDKYIGLEYTEEREYIKEKRKKKKRFNIDRYPKELKEQIRYFYRKYLNKLKKQNINIEESDTSLEINNKAETIYEKKIEKIREIYIESRYNDKETDVKKVKEIEKLYNSL